MTGVAGGSVNIAAALFGVTQQAALTVTTTPPPPPPGVASVVLSTNTINGVGTVQGTVNLTTGAGAGGVTINLSSGNTNAATVPQTVVAAQGATLAQFGHFERRRANDLDIGSIGLLTERAPDSQARVSRRSLSFRTLARRRTASSESRKKYQRSL